MDCIYEPKDTQFGQPCKKGYTFCLEERCPDFKEKRCPNQQGE